MYAIRSYYVRENVGRVGLARDVREEGLGLVPADFGKLVHGAQDLLAPVREAAVGEESVKHAPVGKPDRHVGNPDRREGGFHEGKNLEIDGGRIGAHDIEVALGKLAVAARLGLFPAPNLGNMVPLA